jgi:hypothetical protein
MNAPATPAAVAPADIHLNPLQAYHGSRELIDSRILCLRRALAICRTIAMAAETGEDFAGDDLIVLAEFAANQIQDGADIAGMWDRAADEAIKFVTGTAVKEVAS